MLCSHSPCAYISQHSKYALPQMAALAPSCGDSGVCESRRSNSHKAAHQQEGAVRGLHSWPVHRILQGLIAAVAAAGFVMKTYWHKIKSFFGRSESKSLADEEDANPDLAGYLLLSMASANNFFRRMFSTSKVLSRLASGTFMRPGLLRQR